MRALGVTSSRRSPVMPDVKTIAESGVPGFEPRPGTACWRRPARRGAVVEKLNGEIVQVLQLPEVRERLAAEAFELPADTPDQFAGIIKGGNVALGESWSRKPAHESNKLHRQPAAIGYLRRLAPPSMVITVPVV